MDKVHFTRLNMFIYSNSVSDRYTPSYVLFFGKNRYLDPLSLKRFDGMVRKTIEYGLFIRNRHT